MIYSLTFIAPPEIYLQGKIDEVSLDQRLQSYLGILSHANQYTLSQAVKNAYWARMPASSSQEPMTLELPQGRNANDDADIDADTEANRGEAPNNHLITLNILLTARIGPWTIAK